MKKKEEKVNCSTTIDNIINDALINLKNIVDTNTIVGSELKMSDGTIIVPISKIIVGFVAGGGEFDNNTKSAKCYPFAGGSGAGFTVVPIGFLTGKKGKLEFVSTKNETKYDELINLTNKSLKLILDNFTKSNKGK